MNFVYKINIMTRTKHQYKTDVLTSLILNACGHGVQPGAKTDVPLDKYFILL